MLSPNVLWLILIIIAGLILTVIIIAVCEHKILNQNSNTTNNNTLPNTCAQSTTGLINVSDNIIYPCCCAGNGFGGQAKFLPGYNMIIYPGVPVSYLSVCVGYCDVYDQQTNSCTSATNPQAQLQFDQCVSLLEPNNCNGTTLPIAYSESSFYYAQLANVPPCSSTWDCVDITLCQ
jgi:hypothetical protein